MTHQAVSRDKGYSWVIVFTFFIVEIIVDGVRFSYGMFFVEFLAEFDKPRADTAWIGAIMIVVYNLSGPVFAFIVNKTGPRLASFIGSLMAALGLILSSFARNLFHLYFTYGILLGFGGGLVFLSGTVAISHYFLKKRAIAIGISFCGSGVGLFIIPALVSKLFETYTWRGSLYILAGLMLQCCVCSTLYLPFNNSQSTNTEHIEDPKRDAEDYKERLTNGNEVDVVDEPIVIEVQRSLLSMYDGADLRKSEEKRKSQLSPLPRTFADLRKDQLEGIRQDHQLKTSSGRNLALISQSFLGSNASFQSIVDKHSRNSAFNLQKSAILNNNCETEHYNAKRFENSFIESVFPRELITNIDFIILMVATLLVGTPAFIPFSMLPDYALSVNLTSSQGAWLLSAIGIGGTFGRIGAGFLSDMSCVHNLILNVACFIIIGVATITVALFPVFEVFLTYSTIFGIFFGAIYVVQPIVLIEYCTEQYISEVMGLMMCTYGLSGFIGSPLAGWIFDVTGSYKTTFFFAGILFILGGVVNTFVLCPRPGKRRVYT